MNDNPIAERKGSIMEFLIPIAILAVWIALQAWILPRLGVKT
jgi:hypothetical protein